MAEERHESGWNLEGIAALLDGAQLRPSDRILDLGWNGASMLPVIDRGVSGQSFYTTDLRMARACGDACPGARVLAYGRRRTGRNPEGASGLRNGGRALFVGQPRPGQPVPA